MAVKASATITLNSVVDIQATYRYYLLQSSTATKPSKPSAYPLPEDTKWNDAEPTYTSRSTNSLYFVDLTVFSDGTFTYSEVSLSTAYEAAKEAYNKAVDAQNSVDNLEIGGRNLLKNSNRLYECTSASEYGNQTGFNMVDGYDLQSLIGKTLTFSYFVHCPGERNADPNNGLGGRFGMHGVINWTNSAGDKTVKYPFASYLTTSHENTRVSMTEVLSPPSGYDIITSISISFQSYAIPAEGNSEVWKIGYPKLEIGDKATDWTPAPEDVDASIDSANSKANELIEWQGGAQTDIKKLKDVIYFLAVGEHGEATDFSQFADEFSFSFAKTNQDIADTNDNLKIATDDIEVLRKFMNENKDYINFTTVDDGNGGTEPCIELGIKGNTTGSKFKIRITNTRIMFMEDADIPTYISNKTLITEKVEVNQEFIQSGFVWKKRSNGNYGLSWKGV